MNLMLRERICVWLGAARFVSLAAFRDEISECFQRLRHVETECAALKIGLDARIAALEARLAALEGENSPESAPTRLMR